MLPLTSTTVGLLQTSSPDGTESFQTYAGKVVQQLILDLCVIEKPKICLHQKANRGKALHAGCLRSYWRNHGIDALRSENEGMQEQGWPSNAHQMLARDRLASGSSVNPEPLNPTSIFHSLKYFHELLTNFRKKKKTWFERPCQEMSIGSTIGSSKKEAPKPPKALVANKNPPMLIQRLSCCEGV